MSGPKRDAATVAYERALGVLPEQQTPEQRIAALEYAVDRLCRQANAPRGGWIRATIIVPLNDQETGECRPDVHAKVQEDLRKLGGGESHIEGAGSYVMDDATIADDEGLTYSVLLKAWNMHEDYTMRGIARYVGREMHQESVLVTWERLDGGVMFVRPDSIDNID